MATAFLFVHDLFRFPSAAQWEWLASPATSAFAAELGRRLGRRVPPGSRPSENAELYEQEFIAVFEAGVPHAPVPLIESHYNKRDPVPRILHENILFHRVFGLTLKDSAAETSDHLRHQLEFVAHLYRLQMTASGEALDAIVRGRTEFAERHLLSWLPAALEKVRATPFRWAERHVALAAALAESARAL
jgi:DMSO reductase family type II enzyme chaperone